MMDTRKRFLVKMITEVTFNRIKNKSYLKLIRKNKPTTPEKVQDISEEHTIPIDEDPPLGVVQQAVSSTREQRTQ